MFQSRTARISGDFLIVQLVHRATWALEDYHVLCGASAERLCRPRWEIRMSAPRSSRTDGSRIYIRLDDSDGKSEIEIWKQAQSVSKRLDYIHVTTSSQYSYIPAAGSRPGLRSLNDTSSSQLGNLTLSSRQSI